MSVQYQVVWGLLLSEIGIFLFLIVPFPLGWKRRICAAISKHRYTRSVAQVVRVMFVLVLLLFLDSSTRSLQLGRQKSSFVGSDRDPRMDMNMNLKMFYSQRNMYLTGFTLFLAIVLNRFMKLTLREVDLEEMNALLRTELNELREDYQLLNSSSSAPSGSSSTHLSEDIVMESINQNIHLRERKPPFLLHSIEETKKTV